MAALKRGHTVNTGTRSATAAAAAAGEPSAKKSTPAATAAAVQAAQRAVLAARALGARATPSEASTSSPPGEPPSSPVCVEDVNSLNEATTEDFIKGLMDLNKKVVSTVDASVINLLASVHGEDVQPPTVEASKKPYQFGNRLTVAKHVAQFASGTRAEQVELAKGYVNKKGEPATLKLNFPSYHIDTLIQALLLIREDGIDYAAAPWNKENKDVACMDPSAH